MFLDHFEKKKMAASNIPRRQILFPVPGELFPDP